MNRWKRAWNHWNSHISHDALSAVEFAAERLECRKMLAGDVTCQVSGDNLTISGTSEVDLIDLEVIAGEIQVNGVATGLMNGDLNNLTIKSKQGNDIISLSGSTSEALSIGGNLKIITASGDDLVAAVAVNVAGNTTIRTASGNDRVTTYDASYVGKTKIATSGGDDWVLLASSAPIPGLAANAVAGGYDVSFGGKSSVSTGGGIDSVVIGSFGGGNPAAAGGGGFAGAVFVGSTLKLNGGGSTDNLNVDGMFYDPEFSMPPGNVSVKSFEPFL